MISPLFVILFSFLSILSIVAALPSQKLLGLDESSPSLNRGTSSNLPLVVWHGLGDKYVLDDGYTSRADSSKATELMVCDRLGSYSTTQLVKLIHTTFASMKTLLPIELPLS